MKKRFKLILSLSVIAIGTGCSNDIVDDNASIGGSSNGYATLTIGRGVITKVAYDYSSDIGLTPSWESDDRISLFDNDQNYITDFQYSSVSESGDVTFTSIVACDIVEGSTYEIIYPAVDSYPTFSLGSDVSFTQSVNGDTSHLDEAIQFTSGEFIYDPATTISLLAQECVIVTTLINIGDWTPKSVNYSCEGDKVTLNLNSYSGGDVKLFVPVNPHNEGSAATFTITYDDPNIDNDLTKQFDLTLSQSQVVGGVYNKVLDLDNPFDYYDAGTPSNTSNENTITLPLSYAISSVGDLDDYSISVSNDLYGGEQAISISAIEIDPADNTNLKFTLSSPIYEDDVVKLSYSGSSTKMSTDRTTLNTFSDKVVDVAITNIVNSDYLTMYSFEDGGSFNSQTGSVKGWGLSTDQYYDGTTSALFDGETLGTTNSSAVAVAYYIGNASNYGLKNLEVGKDYVVRFNIYFDGKGLTIDGTYNPITIRFKGSNSDSAEVKSEVVFDFDTDDSTYQNSWQEGEQSLTIGTTAEPTATTTDGNIAFRFTNTYSTPPSCKFYIDNVRFYLKESIYRSERVAQTTEGIGVGDFTVEEF